MGKIVYLDEFRRKKRENKYFNNVYQFKVFLKGSKPPIWRRIQVPGNYTFWELHVAIQNSMGWNNYHLHEFFISNGNMDEHIRIGQPDNEFGVGVLSERKEKIKDYFHNVKDSCDYIYDFGDDWHHKVEFEKVIPKDENRQYPICLSGKRACPPENSGGIGGYSELLSILKNPGHEEYLNYVELKEGNFNPEQFNIKDVIFCDPEKEWKDRLI